jgi:hypothetical protein
LASLLIEDEISDEPEQETESNPEKTTHWL